MLALDLRLLKTFLGFLYLNPDLPAQGNDCAESYCFGKRLALRLCGTAVGRCESLVVSLFVHSFDSISATLSPRLRACGGESSS